MEKMRYGKTEMVVNRVAFGALPIQRVNFEVSDRIFKKAYDAGIDFYDTAHFYTDSQEKIGRALHGVRDKIKLASKTMAKTPEQFNAELDNALKMMKTDYVDLYQFHNPAFCPKPGDGTGLYEAMEAAVKAGKVLHIGITNHRQFVAHEAIESGLYESLQFPYNYLATPEEEEIVKKCVDADMGFLVMKAMSGGLLSSAKASFAHLWSVPGVLPIWGIQRESELDEFIEYMKNPPELDDELKAIIAKDREELAGEFCRSCGYCMPCPVNIEINNCARMSLLIRRSPAHLQLTPEVQAKMMNIENCTECGQCRSRCPYSLDTPELLKKNLEDYKDILAGKVEV